MRQRAPQQEPDRASTVRPLDGHAPPANLEAEAAVLSSLLLDESGAALDEVRAMFGERKAFYSEANQRVYESACAVADDGSKVDVVTVANKLKAKGHLEFVGGPPYLASLVDATPFIANVKQHAEIVFDHYRARQAIAISRAAVVEGYQSQGGAEFQKWLEKLEVYYSDLAHSTAERRLKPISDYADDANANVQAVKTTGAQTNAVTTGFKDLDAKTTGMHEGDLLLVAGRPGMGKSGLAFSMATKLAAQGYAVPIFSLEMPGVQVALRLLAGESRVDLKKLRSGMLDRSDWSKLASALVTVKQWPIFVDDTPASTPFDVRAQCKRLQRQISGGHYPNVTQQKIGAVFIDYLQLMAPTRQLYSREQEIASIARDLKNLAKLLGAPVVALCQLNREAERRNDKRPQLSDLRESGSLEQEADVVMFVYRPAYYTPDDPALRGWAEIILAKQRNGPTGSERLSFRAETTRFENLERSKLPVYDPQERLPVPPEFDDEDDDDLFQDGM